MPPTSRTMTDPSPSSGQPGSRHPGPHGGSGAGDGDSLRERCESMGIGWVDEAPPAEAEAVALLEADDAVRLRVNPRLVRVQDMRRKWGSCSSCGTITLAMDLADQDALFQDFVIVHELLHLRYTTHGRLFKALLSVEWR